MKNAKGLILPSNEKQKLVELETINTDAVTLGVFKIPTTLASSTAV